MFRRDEIRPDEASIYDQPEFSSYGRRSFNGLLLVGAAIIVGAGLLYWGFPDSDEAKVDPQVVTVSQPMTQSQYNAQMASAMANGQQPSSAGTAQAGAAQAEEDDIFDSIGDAIADFGDAIPEPKMQSTPTPSFAAGTSSGVAGGATVTPGGELQSAMINMELQEARAESLSTQAQMSTTAPSIYGIMSKEVVDGNNKKLGRIDDIIIDRKTGEGMAILVDTNNRYYGSPLRALSYEEVLSQNKEGDIKTITSKDNLESRAAFDYQNLNDGQYVSLKLLQDGQILDFENRVVGSVEAIEYKDAKAQNVYIRLDPNYVPKGKEDVYRIPFNDLASVKGKAGYNMKLSETQTRDLAEYLF